MKTLRPASELRSRNPRLGRCYELAGEYVCMHQDAVLVHGTIQGFGYPPNPHAWVVLPDGQVHDPVADIVLSADAHASMFNATEQVRYTYEQMARHAFVTRHWGPWHEQERT